MAFLYIIDTNVLVAGLITQDQTSPTARLIDALLGGGILFILSPALLSEFGTVLLRPRIAKHHGLSFDEVDVLLTEITGNAICESPQRYRAVPRRTRVIPIFGIFFIRSLEPS